VSDWLRGSDVSLDLDRHGSGPGRPSHWKDEDAEGRGQDKKTGEQGHEGCHTGTGHRDLLAEMDHPLAQVPAVEEGQSQDGNLPGTAGDGSQRFEIGAARAGEADDLAVYDLLAAQSDAGEEHPNRRVEPEQGADGFLEEGPEPVAAPHVEQLVADDAALGLGVE